MDFKKVLDQTVRELKREVNEKVLKVPEIEQKVLDATSNEPWGPHGTAMAEIAQATRNHFEYQMIMTIIWKRLSDTGRNWRHVYKALTLLEYLVAHGSERVIDDIREHGYQISALSDFQYLDPSGKDQGINVRKKSQNIMSLVNDKEKIREARQKAIENRDKYRGVSSTGGIYKPSTYQSSGGSDGDRYREDGHGGAARYGGRDDYGYRDGDLYRDDDREKDWEKDRNGRGGDPYDRDVDKYDGKRGDGEQYGKYDDGRLSRRERSIMAGAVEQPHNGEALDIDIDIVVSNISYIKPSIPTPPHILYLCGIDQLFKIIPPNRTILFYPTPIDPQDAAASLHRAIASTLGRFYPLAGRIILDDGRLALSCNDAGVQFVQASCSLEFSQVESSSNANGNSNFQIRPFFRHLVPLGEIPYCNHNGNPIMSVQITSFVGGLSVGFAISHVVADGFSSWTLIRAISECCLGLPPSVNPIHARALLKPDVYLLNKFSDLPAEDVLTGVMAPYAGSTEVTNESPKTNLMLIEPEKLRQVVVSFDKEAIMKLKEECYHNASQTDGNKEVELNTFYVLSAYLWKRLIVAQGLSKEIRVDLRIPLDVRGRMIPPLTSAFFGNAIVGLTVPSTVGELVAGSLGEIARKIRSAVKEGNDAYIKRAIAARENLSVENLFRSNVMCYNIRNASQFPVFQSSDFGWGPPIAVRPPWESREGELTWYPSRSIGSIDVILGLSDNTALAFCSPSLLPDDPLSYLFFA